MTTGILVGIGMLATFGVAAWGVIVGYVARADAADAREIARDAREIAGRAGVIPLGTKRRPKKEAK